MLLLRPVIRWNLQHLMLQQPALQARLPLQFCTLTLRFCPPPCAKAELNDLDPAESYACQCLKESNFSRAAVAHLFSILDKDPPPAKFDAPNARSFSAGCYSKGGLVGLRSACRKYPVTCAFLNQFVRSIRPDFRYSSLSLFQDLRTGVHKDSKNAAEDNLLIPISDFEGGGIWLEGPGSDVQLLNGTPLTGQNLSVHPFIQFPAYSKHHCALPWTGTRLVLVAYSVARLCSLNPRDREVVQSTGFPLPEQSICFKPLRVLLLLNRPVWLPKLRSSFSASGPVLKGKGAKTSFSLKYLLVRLDCAEPSSNVVTPSP